jgi:hypothetical protein
VCRIWAGNDPSGGAVFVAELQGAARGRPALVELAAMERWMRTLAAAQPEPVAVGASVISALVIAATFIAALPTTTFRAASLAAAGAFLLLVAIGVSLYAWRLGPEKG